MASRIKQDVLKFPICKTRSSKNRHLRKLSYSTSKSDCLSPVKVLSESTPSDRSSTPRKKKLDYNDLDQENALSPSKRKCSPSENQNVKVSLNRDLNIVSPKRNPLEDVVLNTPKKDTHASRNLKLASADLCSPQKLCQQLTFDCDIRRSPRKKESEHFSLSELSLSSPKTSRNNIGLYKSELKPYQALKSSLSQNSNNLLVGRETELNFLREFFDNHLRNCIASSLYISGAPGTGKTATVTKIIGELNGIRFKKVFINCMAKNSSKEIFASVAEGLNLKPCRVKKDLNKHIEKALTCSSLPILIILDEVDQLESKNQEVLYTLFEWPSLAKSKLVLVGIANMLDLTDRILPRLEASRTCRPHLLHFPPYSKTEIVEIINKRIREADVGDVTVIKPSAVHFLAAKVSSVAGDVRKALDVCRRAVELCEIHANKQLRLAPRSPAKSPRKFPGSVLKQVDITQILSIFNEVYGNRVTTEITEHPNSFPLQQKILICTLLLILKYSKTKNVSLGKFHEIYCRVCLRQKLTGVEQSEFFSLCTLLESRGILQVKKTKELRNSKIVLRLNEEEAVMALGDKTLLATILEDKDSLMKSSHKKA